MINYFNFKKYKDSYLLTNDFGDYIFLSKNDFHNFLDNNLDCDSELYKTLLNKQFILPNNKEEIVNQTENDYRFSKSHLLSSTSLHIFVVANECNMRCVYCQARNDETHIKGVMNKEIAKRAVDIALSSPEKTLNFEFQGGEPLVNFEIIKFIIEYAEEHKGYHIIHYSIVTNLSLLADEILEFCMSRNVGISTSLDGPDYVHNYNRPFIDGSGTFETVSNKIKYLRTKELNLGAIQTTTKFSLKYYKEIVDQYLELGFDNIFIRPLTPLGTAKEVWDLIGYTPEEFLSFYKSSLEYLLELNLQGKMIREGHASLFLNKILRKQTTNYMELRSPCGAAVGQIAYYHNGDIFTCDEGRMLSEMGIDAFKLGNVFESTYDDLVSCDTCKAVCISSLLESLPGCCDCVYQPYCGVCPVINYAQENNIFRRNISNYRCQIYKGMLDIIFEILYNANEEKKEVLRSW